MYDRNVVYSSPVISSGVSVTRSGQFPYSAPATTSAKRSM
jgi:hypothetical protein